MPMPTYRFTLWRRWFAVCLLFVLAIVLFVNSLKFLPYYELPTHPLPSYADFDPPILRSESVGTSVAMSSSDVLNIDVIYEEATKELRTMVVDENRRKSARNCNELFMGNATEIALAKKLKYRNYGNYHFIMATRDCAHYRRLRDYRTYRDVTDRERSYPLAYSIVVHHDIDGFERLLRAIYRPHNIYCVHVDRKSPTLFFEAVSNMTRCFANVFLSSKREIVVYGGFTRLQADLNCFADLVAYDWKYVLNYAGQELPLRPNNQLVDILTLYNNSNIMIRQTAERKLHRYRWFNRYVTTTNDTSLTGSIKLVSPKNMPPPFSVRMTKGSAYGVFNRAFVEYVLYDDAAQAFLAWCASTYSPDEHFWATLNNGVDNAHMGAPGATRGDPLMVSHDYVGRYVVWSPLPCHGTVVRGICVFGAGDLPSFIARRELVANKFSLAADATPVECVEELLDERHRKGLLEPSERDYYVQMARIAKGSA